VLGISNVRRRVYRIETADFRYATALGLTATNALYFFLFDWLHVAVLLITTKNFSGIKFTRFCQQLGA
ncbi:TPA: hypothetical protein ACNUZJ_003055, partial [Raoultella ornithinolytica]